MAMETEKADMSAMMPTQEQKETYVKGLKAAKEETLAAANKCQSVHMLLHTIAEEAGVDFPYLWNMKEAERYCKEIIPQIEVDIQAFEALETAQAEEKTEEKTEEKPTPKNLQELVEGM